MTDDALTLDDVPQHLLVTGPQRREAIACDLFALGWPFEAIDAAMILCVTIDLALTAHIRDTLPTLRGLTEEAASDRLIADIEQVRQALIGDAESSAVLH